jgi:predicted flap endonuclease-1-like 5' DNA nuclease
VIWHLAEVWLLVVLTFVVGCLAGAHLYGLIADSRFAIAQGIVADAIGDALDRVKARVGLAPAWRPVHLRHVERSRPEEHDDPADLLPEIATPVDERVLAPARAATPMADHTPRSRAPTRPTATRPAPLPARPAVPAIAAPVVPKRPSGLATPRGGVPDNLQRIKGIGKRNEELLNGLGIFHFGQIAAWTPGEIHWIGHHLTFPERIQRDNWVGQATLLAMGAETGFQKSAERRRERRRRERDFGARMANASAAYDDSVDRGEAAGPEAAALSNQDSAGESPEVADGAGVQALPPAAEDDAEGDLSALADNDEVETPR